ncbi:MAG: hypothetical protein IJS56_03835 [Bacilli bacterium]|nr:hypothetical protein [Bacilli bacterium]
MKKIILALLLIVLPVTVFAAEAPAVTKLTVSNSKGTITYNGEIEDGSLAVMCKLYNSKDEEIDLYSTEVNENKFEGTFTVVKNDTYTVYCANYEGGNIKSETIKVDDIVNPKTGDLIELYCLVFAFCIAALILALMAPKYLKKRKGTKTTASVSKTSSTNKKTTSKKAPKKTTSKKTSKK